MSQPFLVNLDDFSLTKGGPFFRLMVRSGLIKPDFTRPARRAIAAAVFIWAPMFVLSVTEGLAFDGSTALPFLWDFAVHVRFLIAVPLLIAAEVVLHLRTRAVVRHFVNSGLVEEKDYGGLESIVRHAQRLRDSLLAEAVIVGIVILSAVHLRVEYEGTSTWQFLVSDAGRTRTSAGWWYLIVGIPIFQFLLGRWIWRFFIWALSLRRLSRMDLRLIPTHPDLAAGLGFLSSAQAQYGVIVFALSSVMASKIGEEILYGGGSLVNYKFIIGGYVILMLIVLLAPLLVFSPKLWMVKRRGLLEYSALAHEYAGAFHRKWIRKELPHGESLLGSSDIQSLADLAQSFECVRNMRAFPLDLKGILPLFIATALPMLPLVLTLYPFDELVVKIVGLLF